MPDLEQSQAAFIAKWENEVHQMNYAELRMLNQMVVDRIKLIHQAGNLMEMAKFHVGELVAFTDSYGVEQTGRILRINKKTISVEVGTGGYWKVSPQFLRKVSE